ncbi:glycosyltransferase [Sphingobium subterraneum]|uniref:Alpha-1,6-mannosyltransferase n=1 Tax=Sphingobium subterraneum TaxID=627688 RepID=A0A841J081_9SPHN|nr:glycosyltransferase [Sphingobium subterraneum]MBB6124629.1 alpha-1,6-mannosyltransferase [Sphingobium subterraneum]
MTMRIVDVCAFYSPHGGGVKTYVEQKLRASRPGEQQIVLVVPGAQDAVIPQESGGFIRVVKAPLFPLDRRYRYFRDETALHDVLDALAPDLVEVSSPWSSPAMVARWRGRVPRALIMHADPLSAYAYRWFSGVMKRNQIDRQFDWFWRHLRRLDDQFDIVICANGHLGRRLVEGGLKKVQVVPMGVQPNLFSPCLRDIRLRARMLARCGLDERATLLVAMGRHGKEKRWPMVFQGVTAAGFGNPVGLILFGDGRSRASVVRAAAHNPHIHLAAPVSDRHMLASILASSDALVHGCEAETFCMAAAEARASGLPIVVPNYGGAADQFVPGQGALFTAGSAASLADALRHFLAGNVFGAREAAVAQADSIPSMDMHFQRLFSLYLQQRDRISNAA